MPNLTVIVTLESAERLGELIEGLREDATGYSPGLDVRKDEKVHGKYILGRHRGTITDDIYPVRVVAGNILAGKAAGIVEGMLRRERIPFKRYDGINLENPNAENPEINLPKRPELSFTP